MGFKATNRKTNRKNETFGLERFWSLIEQHVDVGSYGGIHSDRLLENLALLSIEELLAYQEQVSALSAASRTWRLWGAAHLIHGGCPDDTFDYFRSWLIGQGRHVFESVLANPDSLASLATEQALDDEIYSSGEAALRSKGHELEWKNSSWPTLEQDIDFSDEEQMQRCYPRLHKRFGGA